MKRVYTAYNPVEAHLVKGLLEAANMSAVVQGDYLFGLRGEIPLTLETGPSVWVVQDEDFAQARAVVEEFDQRRIQGEGRTWQCRGCGEVLEGQFTDCWRCGMSRPPEG